ncbi:hypothetical protein [Vibrio vulnificus YJ016]|uniref:Uncharacterized protein n=1 Tax=Vibrio vulnificus (strain YJ016) TaxID=196600 RepID=Q7M797_VIBVY|nr:hypothetical protein [Vibrio vulnificus YJ016]BAC96823.1 hypothetical protein [Vibrio vulnificus YJ016]
MILAPSMYEASSDNEQGTRPHFLSAQFASAGAMVLTKNHST